MDIVIDTSDVIIETPRLIMRAWQYSDLNDLFEYTRVDGVLEMMGQYHHKDITDAELMLKKLVGDKSSLAIECRDSGKVIGSVGFSESWANKTGEIQYEKLKLKELTYILSKEFWGKAIMPEAVNAVISYLFQNYDLDALTCGHFAINEKSRKVIEKNGFTYVGMGKYYSKQQNKDYDNLNYILYRADVK